MAESNSNWVFGRSHAYGRKKITILSYWRNNDPSDENEQETQIIRCADGQVESVFIPFHCVDVLEIAKPIPHAVAVGLNGDIAIVTDGEIAYSVLDDGENGPLWRGDIRSLSQVSGDLYAVGMQRQVYRRAFSGSETIEEKWEHFENGIKWSPDEMSGFNALDGFDQDEIYAAGWSGELQVFNKKKWQTVELPTNLKIERVLASPTQEVFLSGIRGVVLRGRGDSFQVIPHSTTDESIWGMCWAFDCLWLASAKNLFRVADDDLIRVDVGLGEDFTFRCLTHAGGRLWSTGQNHVIYTDDGETWNQVFF